MPLPASFRSVSWSLFSKTLFPFSVSAAELLFLVRRYFAKLVEASRHWEHNVLPIVSIHYDKNSSKIAFTAVRRAGFNSVFILAIASSAVLSTDALRTSATLRI